MSTKSIIKVQQVRGLIGVRAHHRACVKGLGLRKIGQVRELVDTSAVRGMVNKVPYLVKIVN